MQLKFYPYDLKFDEVFAVAVATRMGTDIIYVELEWEGLIGFGEASFPPYMKEKRDDNLLFLQRLNFEQFESPLQKILIEKYLEKFEACFPAKAALDMALLDLIGKFSNIPLHQYFESSVSNPIQTSFTIGIGEDDFILRQLKKAQEFKSLKIKLNGDIGYNQHVIDYIKQHSSQILGVDFNQGINDAEVAMNMIKWLYEKGVAYVEQPMPKEMKVAYRWLKQNSPLDIYGDESIQHASDILQQRDLFHGVNIKLMKCGGVSNAYQMIQTARSLGLKVMLGCMAESTCAINAAASLAKFCDRVDLDGHLMMTNDLFEGVDIENGDIILNSLPGLGVVKK